MLRFIRKNGLKLVKNKLVSINLGKYNSIAIYIKRFLPGLAEKKPMCKSILYWLVSSLGSYVGIANL